MQACDIRVYAQTAKCHCLKEEQFAFCSDIKENSVMTSTFFQMWLQVMKPRCTTTIEKWNSNLTSGKVWSYQRKLTSQKQNQVHADLSFYKKEIVHEESIPHGKLMLILSKHEMSTGKCDEEETWQMVVQTIVSSPQQCTSSQCSPHSAIWLWYCILCTHQTLHSVTFFCFQS